MPGRLGAGRRFPGWAPGFQPSDAHPQAVGDSKRRLKVTRLLSSHQQAELASVGLTWLTPVVAAPGFNDPSRLCIEDHIQAGFFSAHQAGQLIMRAAGDDLAVVHDGACGPKAPGPLPYNEWYKYGQPWAVQLLTLSRMLRRALRIDPYGRLIHDDHLGFMQQRHADIGPGASFPPEKA